MRDVGRDVPGNTDLVESAAEAVVRDRQKVDEHDDQHGIEDSKDVADIDHMRLVYLLNEMVEKLGCHSAGAMFIGSQRLHESVNNG